MSNWEYSSQLLKKEIFILGEKEKILAKLNMKDYKNDLELILEEKQFDEEAKSLLLGIFYKLDNFYKDYITVKKDTELKNQYLENYINIIKTKCKAIHLIKPKEIDGKKKYEIDKKKGEIRCVPNEIILLYAVYELAEKNISEEKYLLEDFTKICVNNVLNKGKTINSTEPIRDFNGWSWNIQIDSLENIVYNLIFQNILILLGYNFISENINKSNILENIRLRAKKKGYGEQGNEFINDLFGTCIILYNNKSMENHERCLKYKKSIINQKNMLNNRKEYVEDKNKDSSSISKQIQTIDKVLNDIDLIRSEYKKCIKDGKNKYLCISEFVESMENEKQELLKKIKENNKVLSQRKYLSEHDNYEITLNLYEQINDEQESINYQTNILNLQKHFLQCFKSKIEKIEQKKELFNSIVQLRYYCNLFYKKDKNIISQNKLSTDLDIVINKIVSKMTELKLVDTGFKSEKLNCQILKYIFKTKIIELEAMGLKISFIEKNQIEVEYYDSKILEHKEIFEIPSEEEIANRKDRKIKLFKIGG